MKFSESLRRHMLPDSAIYAMFYVVRKEVVQKKDGSTYTRLRRIKLPPIKCGKRYRRGLTDTVRDGITKQPPGKSRVADLARWYAEHPGESAFNV